MHLKKLIKEDNNFFIEHYVIVDAIDGSNTYYEKLTIKNLWRYLPQIVSYIYWEWEDKRIQRRRDENKEES